jgi:hypothetical protein
MVRAKPLKLLLMFRRVSTLHQVRTLLLNRVPVDPCLKSLVFGKFPDKRGAAPGKLLKIPFFIQFSRAVGHGEPESLPQQMRGVRQKCWT